MAENSTKVKHRKVTTKPDKKTVENKPNANTVTSNRLELLVTIVSRKKAEYFADLIQSLDVNMQVTAFGHGTADAKMLVYLGLADSEKAVIFSVIQQNKIPSAIALLEEKFTTIKDGKGVAFTIPLTSVIGTLIYRFLSNNRMTVQGDKK
ncbi:MAG: hypothetical protein K2L12_08100 [Clostridia bacterium]|nr:hypothetical protein [Clostridia bacterium]